MLLYLDEDLRAIAGQLFNAGAETTATVLRWLLLLVCKYDEVKERVQSEIDDNIGK